MNIVCQYYCLLTMIPNVAKFEGNLKNYKSLQLLSVQQYLNFQEFNLKTSRSMKNSREYGIQIICF